MATKQDVKDSVKKGAQLLDEKRPGWHLEDFDWNGYDIHSSSLCLLGQLWKNDMAGYGTPFTAGTYALGIVGQSTSYGFAARSWIDGCNRIGGVNALYKKLWQKAVNERITGGVISEETVPASTISLNPTEKALLTELLAGRVEELHTEQDLLKPQNREFLNPPLMTARALLTAVRDA